MSSPRRVIDVATLLAALALVALGYLVVRIGRWESEQTNKGAAKIVCPHCKASGGVTVTVSRPRGGMSSVAMGGLISGGLALLATASKDVRSVTMACSNCGVRWDVHD